MTVLVAALGVALLVGSACALALGRRRPYVGRHRAPF